MKTPIQYGIDACDTLMRKFDAPELPPANSFHYHAGVFLSGMGKLYALTGDERYFDYAKAWIDSQISPEGNILRYNPGALDDLQPGVLIFPLYERFGSYAYKEALDTIAYHIEHFPRCENGGFWHKAWYHGQMWLDGLYMGGPFMAMYGATFHKPEYFDLVAEQARIMREVTLDAETGLWRHAWDSKGKCSWADPETGCSPEFWGRSLGWVPVALLEESDFIPKEHPAYKIVTDIAVELLKAIVKYQDASNGLWHQVIDKTDAPDNWHETSCSCLFVSALYKAVRKGLLDSSYLQYAHKGYEGVIKSLTYDENGICIGGVCIGTGVGDYKHYIARPVSVNDLHGVGAFLLMCAEVPERS